MAKALDNKVLIDGGALGGAAYGGRAVNSSLGSATAEGNSLTVRSGSVDGDVFGGQAEAGGSVSARSEGNSVSVSGGMLNGAVHGGNAESDSGPAAANGNIVSVSGGSLPGAGPAAVQGGRAHSVSGPAQATGNSVEISGVSVDRPVHGGYAYSGGAGPAAADGNSVSVSGGVLDASAGLYGGWAHTGSGATEGASASGNTVSISGNAVIKSLVIGGFVEAASGRAENNRIIISGRPDMRDAWVSGGSSGYPDVSKFSGNTLVTATDETLHLNGVDNVENFEFVLPAGRGKDYVALKANHFYFGNGKTGPDELPSRVTSITSRDGEILRPGDTLTLFQMEDGSPVDVSKLLGLNGLVIPGRRGMSLLYEYTLTGDGRVWVSGVRLNPQTKALAEGQAAGLAFLTQGSDLIADGGLRAAVSGAAGGLSAFAATGGGWSRYHSGSHVDVSGMSVIAGLALGADLPPGRLTLGAFFEGGWGSYDTYNSFSNAATVKGDGETSYVGGGILGRLDSKPLGPGRAYLEVSGRMGESSTDFSSSDLSDGFGRQAEYELEGVYYGAHAGLGYVWKASESVSLDLYGKYFWTRQEGDSLRVAGDPVKFESTDSHRLRAGGRLSFAASERIAPYIGAAYEHELDGRTEARIYGYRTDSPDLSGPTGIGEIGLSLLGGEGLPLSLDLGVQGYAGTREGLTGSLQLKLEF
jgi:hypothetical protein